MDNEVIKNPLRVVNAIVEKLNDFLITVHFREV